MTDLTYCYLHMSQADIDSLDTLDDIDYIDGQLSDEELDIPAHMIPPNPDDTDTLPSEIHPSYPYGNPLSLSHPASLPRIPHDFTSRALYEDIETAYGLSSAMRWKDLALDQLLPLDEEKEERLKAELARKMASGTQGGQNTSGHQQPPTNGTDQFEEDGVDEDLGGEDDEDDDEDNEDDDDDDEEDDEDDDEEEYSLSGEEDEFGSDDT